MCLDWNAFIVGLALLAAAPAGCRAGGSEAEHVGAGTTGGARVSAASESAPLKVVVRRPQAAAATDSLVLPGSIEPWETAALYARTTGYLESVSVDIGDQVERGAELARIVVPEMSAELRRAEADVQQQQAELDLARLTRNRLEKLLAENSEAVARQDVDAAAAKERIEAAQVKVAKANHDRLRTLSSFAQVRAPFTGRITKRILDPGALVRAGTSTGAQPIVEIARTDRLRVAFEVPELLARHVKKGTPAAVRFDALPGEEVEASVARVAGSLDPRTRSMRAELDLGNAEQSYQSGMYAAVRVEVPVAKNALAVPSRAIRGQGADRYCLVARDGVLHRRPVVVASDDGRRALVVRGLSREDQVVMAGSPLARDGVRCEAIEEQAR